MSPIMTQLLDTSSVHPVSLELGRLFARAGSDLSLVGGPVRDVFLDRDALDLDFTTDATPELNEKRGADDEPQLWEVSLKSVKAEDYHDALHVSDACALH